MTGGVGLTVGPFVAVVVSESVGQDHQEAPTGSPLPIEYRRPMTDGGSEARESSGTESTQATFRQCRETLVESLYGKSVHGRASLGAKSVKGHSIPHLAQRPRETRRTGSLMLVDDTAGSARLARRTGNIQEDEHREVPPASLVLDVDIVIRE